ALVGLDDRLYLVPVEVEGGRDDLTPSDVDGGRRRDAGLRAVRRGKARYHLGGQDRDCRARVDRDGLVSTATPRFLVVGVAGVGARRRGAGAVGGFIAAVGRHRHGAVAGDQAAFGRRAALVVIELEGDRAAHVFAEGAGQRGLVLEGVTDGARGGVLGGFDRG